jgi:hypothetical protein
MITGNLKERCFCFLPKVNNVFINFLQVEFGCAASLSAGDELPLRQGSGSQPDAPQHSGIAASPRGNRQSGNFYLCLLNPKLSKLDKIITKFIFII